MKKLKLHNVITIVLCVFTAQMKAASGPVSVLPQSVPQQFLPQAYSQAQPNQNAIDVNQLIQLDNQINLQVASKIAFLTALNISAAGVFTPEQFAQALNQTPAEEFNYFMTLFNAIAQELKRADLFTNEMHMRFNKRPFLIEEVANFQKLLAQTIISKFRLDQKMMLNAHLQSLLNKIEAIQRAHAHKYQEEQKQQAAEVQKTTTTQLKLNPNEAGKNMLNINPPAQPRAPLTQMQTGNNQQPKSAANCAAPSQPVAEQRKKQEVQSQMHPALTARQGTVTQKGVAITHTRLPSNWE